jgi:hypothetical protein
MEKKKVTKKKTSKKSGSTAPKKTTTAKKNQQNNKKEQVVTKKNNTLKIVVLILALLVIVISVSFSYYTARISGEASKTAVTAATLDLTTDLETVNVINNTNIRLIEASDKEKKAETVTFNVTNPSTSTVSAKYFIYLKEINLSKNLYSSYFKWELLKNGSVIASGTFANANRTSTASDGEANNVLTTADDIELNTDAITIDPDNKDEIVFRIWLENDTTVNQINLTEGSFSGKLYLEAVPVRTGD